MKRYGNISAMDSGKIEPVDIITFGSPCQDMSVAGPKRRLGRKAFKFFVKPSELSKK